MHVAVGVLARRPPGRPSADNRRCARRGAAPVCARMASRRPGRSVAERAFYGNGSALAASPRIGQKLRYGSAVATAICIAKYPVRGMSPARGRGVKAKPSRYHRREERSAGRHLNASAGHALLRAARARRNQHQASICAAVRAPRRRAPSASKPCGPANAMGSNEGIDVPPHRRGGRCVRRR